MDEVKEVINMPEFDGSTAQQSRDYRQVVIPADITSELGHYVSAVARLYRNNPFHNFGKFLFVLSHCVSFPVVEFLTLVDSNIVFVCYQNMHAMSP